MESKKQSILLMSIKRTESWKEEEERERVIVIRGEPIRVVELSAATPLVAPIAQTLIGSSRGAAIEEEL